MIGLIATINVIIPVIRNLNLIGLKMIVLINLIVPILSLITKLIMPLIVPIKIVVIVDQEASITILIMI